MTPLPSFEQTLTLRSEHLAAYERLIAEATDSIAWLDGNFEFCGLAGPVIYERLREYLIGGRSRKLRLLMAKTHFLEKKAARFALLQDRFSEQISCRVINDNQWEGNGAMIIDARHLVTRVQPGGWRGYMGMDATAQAEPLSLRFDMLWDESTPCLPRTTLGL